MQAALHVIVIQPTRILATEVVPAESAVLLDAGLSILLTTPGSWVALAARHKKPLTVLTRQEALQFSALGLWRLAIDERVDSLRLPARPCSHDGDRRNTRFAVAAG